jgi:hypothetical protein
MKSERQGRAIAFLKAAIDYYGNVGIKVERVITDNGPCYKSIARHKPPAGYQADDQREILLTSGSSW